MTPVKAFGFLLDGHWIAQGELHEIRAPYDGEVVGTVVYGTRKHAEAAVAAAVKAFETTRRLPAYERQRVLRFVAEALVARKDEFTTLLAREAGKPLKQARGEVERAIATFSIAAEESTRINGEVLPLDTAPAATGRWGIVKRFPLGPISAITPFNFPLNLVAHKLAPAIACGCTVVLKPPPQDPLSALMLAEVVQQAGWPDGALNVLNLSNEDAAPLITDERIKLLSFTGSTAAGWELKKKAGKKRVVLELGGNAGCIVHGDADLKHAADRCATGGFGYAGQTCISVQRIFVERKAMAEFTGHLVAAARALKTGDPLDASTDIGPMIREADAVRAVEWIEEAVAGGARLLCGGQRHGSFVQPTVLTGSKPGMRVNCLEVFAPVVTVEPYEDFNDALRRVNDSPWGLQAGLFARDARLIFRAFEELQVGGVIAGDIPTWRMDQMPYGGVKDSGLGREGLRYAIEEMTERKLLVMNVQ
jgi:acyl-CoA reductase-like NAD-dependent aldehyde dehydrogenase